LLFYLAWRRRRGTWHGRERREGMQRRTTCQTMVRSVSRNVHRQAYSFSDVICARLREGGGRRARTRAW